MPKKSESTEAAAGRLTLPDGLVWLPPVTVEDLKADTEHDPDGAEEFVALVRALRRLGSRPLTL